MREEKTKTLCEEIEDDIISGALKPGRRLRINEMSRKYGMSAIPIREALSRLVSRRFVIAEEQRGFRVASISEDELRDITEVRILVEREALRRCMKVRDVQWEAKILSLYYRLRETRLLKDGCVTDLWEKLHDEFHSAVLDNCGSTWLMMLSDLLRTQSTRYRYLSIKRSPVESGPRRSERDVEEEHRVIVEAILERDVDRACNLLEQHYRRTMDIVSVENKKPNSSLGKAAEGWRS